MKKFYLLLSILFLATSFTFAQTNKAAQANKKRAAQIQKQREQQQKKTAKMQQQRAKEQQKNAQIQKPKSEQKPKNTVKEEKKPKVKTEPLEPKNTPTEQKAEPQKQQEKVEKQQKAEPQKKTAPQEKVEKQQKAEPQKKTAPQQKMSKQQKAAQQQRAAQQKQIAKTQKAAQGKTKSPRSSKKKYEATGVETAADYPVIMVECPMTVVTPKDNPSDTIKVRKRNWFDSWKKYRKLDPIQEKEKTVKLYGGDALKGFIFDFISCEGDPSTGKVTFTFSYYYSSRTQQEVYIPRGSYAQDQRNEKYAIAVCDGVQRFQTVTKSVEKITLCMRYVPASTKELISVSTSFNTSKAGNTVIEFCNVPINWVNKND